MYLNCYTLFIESRTIIQNNSLHISLEIFHIRFIAAVHCAVYEAYSIHNKMNMDFLGIGVDTEHNLIRAAIIYADSKRYIIQVLRNWSEKVVSIKRLLVC